MADAAVKERVREFYDSIGWKEIGDGVYQNARYEDLRPVAREYIHRCHLRVLRHLHPEGRYMLDAGSGPIQYPEYLTYSEGYQYRVCMDISIRAIQEARQRIGKHGLFVVGDLANLPFAEGVFGGIVSLHTIHHLPLSEHKQAYVGLYRVLEPDGRSVIVSSWAGHSPLMRFMSPFIRLAFGVLKAYRRIRGRQDRIALHEGELHPEAETLLKRQGTFTATHNYRWVRRELAFLPGLDVRVWRSVSSSFLRAFIHQRLMGRFLLMLLYEIEEVAPRFLGRIGQYPMILFYKPPQ
ncbi:MAG: class I SAM-dependent methyltransferase [Anaerolineales bacterium]|nr:MAG: class I SAM-dependent methyltransferase [Anaerolineales bacterium]